MAKLHFCSPLSNDFKNMNKKRKKFYKSAGFFLFGDLHIKTLDSFTKWELNAFKNTNQQTTVNAILVEDAYGHFVGQEIYLNKIIHIK